MYSSAVSSYWINWLLMITIFDESQSKIVKLKPHWYYKDYHEFKKAVGIDHCYKKQENKM